MSFTIFCLNIKDKELVDLEKLIKEEETICNDTFNEISALFKKIEEKLNSADDRDKLIQSMDYFYFHLEEILTSDQDYKMYGEEIGNPFQYKQLKNLFMRYAFHQKRLEELFKEYNVKYPR